MKPCAICETTTQANEAGHTYVTVSEHALSRWSVRRCHAESTAIPQPQYNVLTKSSISIKSTLGRRGGVEVTTDQTGMLQSNMANRMTRRNRLAATIMLLMTALMSTETRLGGANCR